MKEIFGLLFKKANRRFIKSASDSWNPLSEVPRVPLRV